MSQNGTMVHMPAACEAPWLLMVCRTPPGEPLAASRWTDFWYINRPTGNPDAPVKVYDCPEVWAAWRSGSPLPAALAAPCQFPPFAPPEMIDDDGQTALGVIKARTHALYRRYGVGIVSELIRAMVDAISSGPLTQPEADGQ